MRAPNQPLTNLPLTSISPSLLAILHELTDIYSREGGFDGKFETHRLL